MKEMRSGSLANSNEIALFLVPENVMLVHTDVKLWFIMSASIWNIFEGLPIYYQNKLRNLDFFW